jgi:hypothetical protein
MPRQPGHRHSGEMLREVVAAVVPEEDCERYLPFARELYATFHHSRKRGTVLSRTLAALPAKNGGQSLGVAQGPAKVQSPFFSRAVQSQFSASSRKLQAPDFSRRTKMTVMKWFRRGLSGHLMWLIGERLIGRLFAARSSRYGTN